MGTHDEQRDNKTRIFGVPPQNDPSPRDVLHRVFSSLSAKGYEPVDHLVGYLLSGDPTYITENENARYLIQQVERNELLEELVGFYLKD